MFPLNPAYSHYALQSLGKLFDYQVNNFILWLCLDERWIFYLQSKNQTEMAVSMPYQKSNNSKLQLK